MDGALHTATDQPRPALRTQRSGRLRAPELNPLVGRLPNSWSALRDPFILYTAALAPFALLVAVLSDATDMLAAVVLTGIFVGAQVLLGFVPPRSRPLTPSGWSFLRLSVALLYVGGLADLVGGPGKPLVALYVPVVVAAAALGTRQTVLFGAVASIVYLLPELSRPGDTTDLAMRGVALVGVTVLVAVGVRRLVVAVDDRSNRLRTALLAARRRSRQIAGMEAISRLLVEGGPVSELLDQMLGVLVERFDYHYVSIYRAEGPVLRLGAQRGYAHPIEVFDGTSGVVGRVQRTRQLAFVPDVRSDPDYLAVFGEVVSEICAPLVVDDEFLGILNVEAREPLDAVDRDLVASLAGRVATVVALGRDREALAERERIFRNVHEFTRAISGTLDVDRLAAIMVDAARRVIPADLVALTILDRPSGRYLVRAATDAEPEHLGREVRPGESLAGRAVRDRTVVLDEHFSTLQFPTSYLETVTTPRSAVGAGIPLIRDGVVVGALTLLRYHPAAAFPPIEREAMDLLAGHAALAVANAFLHADVAELAIRDPLTSLYNRRYFDETLDRLLAAWRRAEPAARQPIAAITFDLDAFGDFNKQHGHQVGDRVLQAFADILRDRFRASDLVARMGGEEFIAVLDGANRDAAMRVAEDIRARLDALRLTNDEGEPLVVTVSAGCTELDPATPTREQLLRSADVGLFMAKRAGRNRVVAA